MCMGSVTWCRDNKRGLLSHQPKIDGYLHIQKAICKLNELQTRQDYTEIKSVFWLRTGVRNTSVCQGLLANIVIKGRQRSCSLALGGYALLVSIQPAVCQSRVAFLFVISSEYHTPSWPFWYQVKPLLQDVKVEKSFVMMEMDDFWLSFGNDLLRMCVQRHCLCISDVLDADSLVAWNVAEYSFHPIQDSKGKIRYRANPNHHELDTVGPQTQLNAAVSGSKGIKELR